MYLNITVLRFIDLVSIRGYMISKIHQIRGIGRFKNFIPDPTIDLGDVTIVYGENGKGKSTLAAIFRSIAHGNIDEIGRRATIGVDGKSIVLCRDDGTMIAYSSPGLRWSQTIDNLLVFDETFIHENVVVGPVVDVEQRRNLNTVIIGNTARRLVDEEQEIKAEIKSRNDEIRTTRQAIEAKIKLPASKSETQMSFDEFLQLPLEQDIDDELAQQKLLVDQLRGESETLSWSEFERLDLPVIPTSELETLLQTNIEAIGEKAEARVNPHAEASVKAHIGKFSDDSVENWIEEGTRFSSDIDDDCPYCGQSLTRSNLIEHYQAYFSEAYKRLKSDVQGFAMKRLQFASEMDTANKTIAENAGLADLWRTEEIEGLAYPIADFEVIRRSLDDLLDHANILLSEKGNRPLDTVPLCADFTNANNAWDEVGKRVTDYNRQNDENNEIIRKHRQKLAAGDLVEAEKKLLFFINTRIRNSDEVSAHCLEYNRLEIEQQNDNQRKDDIQASIRQEVANTYSLCGKRVNELLCTLNADFTLADLKQRADGTKRQAEFNICLMDAKIPVGGDKTALSGQSYKTTLSEGDRRTLALALFLATLDRNASLEKAIVVFDDPVTSMDDNRSSVTADLLLEVCEKESQVFVLSHRKRFLKTFWEKYKKKGQDKYGFVQLLEVTPKEGDTDFSEIRPNWDIKTETESEFDQNVRYVVEYIRNSPKTDKRNAAPKLRLILENHYKSLYPDEYTDNITKFGEFINKVETCPDHSALVALKSKDLVKLKRLNDVTSTFHHSRPLDVEETELRQFCKDTLNLVGRRY